MKIRNDGDGVDNATDISHSRHVIACAIPGLGWLPFTTFGESVAFTEGALKAGWVAGKRVHEQGPGYQLQVPVRACTRASEDVLALSCQLVLHTLHLLLHEL
jgi:hypothetical protein